MRNFNLKDISIFSLILFAALTFGLAEDLAAQRNVLAKTVWTIESYGAADGQRAVEKVSEADEQFPAIVFDVKGFNGYIAGCNSISFSYTVRKNSLRVRMKTTTMKACSDYLMRQDREISSALGKAKTFKIIGGNLEIYYDKGKVMRLRRSAR